MGQVSVQQQRKGQTIKMSMREFQDEFKPDGSISFVNDPDSTVIDILALVQIESGRPGGESMLIKAHLTQFWDLLGLVSLFVDSDVHVLVSQATMTGNGPDPREAVLFCSPKLLTMASSCWAPLQFRILFL